MSETSKVTEAAKKATDQTARLSQAGIDMAGGLTKEAVAETSTFAQSGMDRAQAAGGSMIETVTETADHAANISSKAAEQSREVLLMGVRTAAGLGSRVADINFGHGHDLLNSAIQAMDIYRDASERSAGRMHALLSSYMTLGRGFQHMQHAWLEMIDHSMDSVTHKPQDLLRCKNIVELAEVQRNLCMDTLTQAFASTTKLLEIASRTAHEAVMPLQSVNN